jgi:hypothetical protein
MTKGQVRDRHDDIPAILASGVLVTSYRVLSVGPASSITKSELTGAFDRVTERFLFIDRGTLDNFVNPPALEEQPEAVPAEAAVEVVEHAGEASAAPVEAPPLDETAISEAATAGEAGAEVEEGEPDAAFAIEVDDDEIDTVVLVTAYLQVADSIAEAGIHENGPFVLCLDADDLANPGEDMDDLLRSIKEWSVENGHGKTLYFVFEGNLAAEEDLYTQFNANEGSVAFVQTFMFEDLPYSVLSLEFED